MLLVFFSVTDAQPMKLMDMRWSEQFEPHYYKKDEAEITGKKVYPVLFIKKIAFISNMLNWSFVSVSSVKSKI